MDTAHSQETAEAVDVPVTDVDSAAAAIKRLAPAPEEESEIEEEGQPVEGEPELEIEEEADEKDEPEAPAIVTPASLTAEEKARYAQLPEEAQQFVAELETRRNAQVQTATTKASEAQRNAEASAARADAQAKAVYAQQLQVFASNLAPEKPDPQLAQTDPFTFIALNAQYDAAKAQHDEFVQQVQALGHEAGEQMAQVDVAERDRFLMGLPEVQNEETRNGFFEKAITAAQRVGIDAGKLNEATGGEWKALREIADAFTKADKYDAAMSKQMQRVSSFKGKKTMKPTAAQPTGSGQQRALAESSTRLKQTGSVDDAAAAIRALMG